MIREFQQLAAGYSEDELRLIVAFYGRMEQVFRDHVIRLREPGPAPGG
jgi:hypothetical protein